MSARAIVLGSALFALACSGCLDDLLEGKACSRRGRCLEGWTCDRESWICVRPVDGGEPDADGDGGADGDAGLPDAGPCPCADGGCAQAFICAQGPAQPIPLGPSGGEVTVLLSRAGLDTTNIICASERRLPAEELQGADFEADLGSFSAAGPIERLGDAQVPDAPGSFGARLCGAAELTGTPVTPASGARIGLSFAARAQTLGAGKYLLAEIGLGDIPSWQVLLVTGDGWRSAGWARHAFRFAPAGVPAPLRLRLRLTGADAGACADVDEIRIETLPPPNAGWTFLATGFEAAEGNTPPDACEGETVVAFPEQGAFDAEVCLLAEAQNPSSTGESGLRLTDNNPSYVRSSPVETRLVPPSSDLAVDLAWRSVGLGADGYGLAWLEGQAWHRLAGIGLDLGSEWAGLSCLQSGAALTGSEVVLRLTVPAEAQAGAGQGLDLDDVSMGWTLASPDEIGPFVDRGGGRYTAPIHSQQAGWTIVRCYYYGESPALATDGVAPNSGPAVVIYRDP